MGEEISRSVQLALVHHVVRRQGPIHSDAVALELGSTTNQPVVDQLLREHEGVLFTQRHGAGWVVKAASDRASAPRPVHDGGKTAARLYRKGPLFYAVLPEWCDIIVCRHLADRGPATVDELLALLYKRNWRDISTSHLTLALAHFQDFTLERGRWHLDTSQPIHVPTQAAASTSAERGKTTCPPSSSHTVPAPRRRSAERSVYITGQGQAYHWDDDCQLLRMGWAKTYQNGAHPTGLREVPVGEAMRIGRHACRRCKGSG
jgi:hypothetical protein